MENPTDIETEVNLEGAEFQIKDKDGKVLDTMTTGKDGTAISNKELPYGTYQVVETKAPEGTTLNETPGEVKIDGSMEDNIYRYTHENQAITGTIRVINPRASVPAGTTEVSPATE